MNHYHKRYEGTFNVFDLKALRVAASQMNGNQLIFLLGSCSSRYPELAEQREIVQNALATRATERHHDKA
jgi:hypothetical protein